MQNCSLFCNKSANFNLQTHDAIVTGDYVSHLNIRITSKLNIVHNVSLHTSTGLTGLVINERNTIHTNTGIALNIELNFNDK